MLNGMIDIHNHLIPKFDDGPKSFDESIQMLRQAEEQGITDVFATSHFNEFIPPEMEQDYFYKLQDLREEALSLKIKVNIHSGSELFYHNYLDKTVRSSRVGTLGELGQYVLLEFPMFQKPDGAGETLFRMNMENLIPILAHPERYSMILDDYTRIAEYIRYGALIQINGGSILGHFGKTTQKTALKLLDEGLAHFIASDAHVPDGRTFVLGEVYLFLKDRLPEDYLTELLVTNPRHILEQKPLQTREIPDFDQEKGIWSRLLRVFKK